jgi:hypothetical protein
MKATAHPEPFTMPNWLSYEEVAQTATRNTLGVHSPGTTIYLREHLSGFLLRTTAPGLNQCDLETNAGTKVIVDSDDYEFNWSVFSYLVCRQPKRAAGNMHSYIDVFQTQSTLVSHVTAIQCNLRNTHPPVLVHSPTWAFDTSAIEVHAPMPASLRSKVAPAPVMPTPQLGPSLKQRLERIQTIFDLPLTKAAAFLGVQRQSLYRWLENDTTLRSRPRAALERLERHATLWASLSDMPPGILWTSRTVDGRTLEDWVKDADVSAAKLRSVMGVIAELLIERQDMFGDQPMKHSLAEELRTVRADETR